MSKVPSAAFCKVHGSLSIGHLFSPRIFFLVDTFSVFFVFFSLPVGSLGASQERLTSLFLSLHRMTNGCVQPTGLFAAHPVPPLAHSHSLPLTLGQRKEGKRWMERWKNSEIVGWVWCKRSVMELMELRKLFRPSLSDLVLLFLSSRRY